MKTNINNSTTVIGRWTRFLGVPLCAGLVVALMVPAVAFSLYNNPGTVNLGTAANFRILAGSAVTIGTGCTVTGDIGVSPTAAFTNNGTLIGTSYVADAGGVASAAKSALSAAYDDISRRTADDAGLAAELSGQNLGRGIYHAGTFAINGVLTLTGGASDIFIFQSAATLITGATCVVSLTGGAVWQNVFWQVTSSATIEGDFKGNILALTSIDQNVGPSIINGRALAQNGAVTVNGHSVLPVELVSFTATANRTNADLHWSTATEVNNYGFEIQRRQTAQRVALSTDWEKVGFVSGAGTSNAPRDYSYTDNNLSPGRYTYRLKQVDRDGAFSYHGSVEVAIGSAPQAFALSQNYPNPFNPSTVISYQLPVNSQVTLKVYDLLGLEVATLVNGRQEAGSYTVPFSAIGGSTLASGVYIYRLKAGSFVSTKKLVLMK